MVDKKKEKEQVEVAPEISEEVIPETPVEVSEEASTSSENFRAKNVALVLQFLPDADTSTDEALFKTLHQVLSHMADIQNKLADVAHDEPEFAAALRDVLKGGKAKTSFLRHYGSDAFAEPEEGDPDYEEYSKYGQERSAKRKMTEERSAMLAANKELSLKDINEYMQEKGWTPEEAEAFVKKCDDFFTDVFDGKITRIHLGMLEKALGYDTAVDEAHQSGKVEGLNEQIVEQKINKETGDGLPEDEGSGSETGPSKKGGLLQELYN